MGGAPGTRGISVEHMESSMVEHVPLQLVEQILIHIAACGVPHPGLSECFL